MCLDKAVSLGMQRGHRRLCSWLRVLGPIIIFHIINSNSDEVLLAPLQNLLCKSGAKETGFQKVCRNPYLIRYCHLTLCSSARFSLHKVTPPCGSVTAPDLFAVNSDYTDSLPRPWAEWALLIYPSMSVSWLSARLSPPKSFVNSVDSYLSSQNWLPNLKHLSCFQGKLCNLSLNEKLFNKLCHQITHEFSCSQMLSMLILLNMSLFSKRCPRSTSDLHLSAATPSL